MLYKCVFWRRKKGRFQGITNGFLPRIQGPFLLYCLFAAVKRSLPPSGLQPVVKMELWDSGKEKKPTHTNTQFGVSILSGMTKGEFQWSYVYRQQMVGKTFCNMQEPCRDLQRRKSLWPRSNVFVWSNQNTPFFNRSFANTSAWISRCSKHRSV